MNILYVGSHSILEYDEVRLLSSLGHDVFSIGAYTDPANPSDDKRPPIEGLTYHADLDALCRTQREKHAGEDARFYIDFAKSDLHPDLIDWADAIIFAAFPEAWIMPQRTRFSGKRIIWRTIGQSDTSIEQYLARMDGLEIVRYSPREKIAFEKLGAFAGEDAVIRFAKDPADWYGWNGTGGYIANVTQDMAGRGEACGYSFWLAATKDLPAKPAGPHSQVLPGGIGSLEYDAMREYLRLASVYLYTGTQPASYTLGLIEAMMTGVPIVVMDPTRVGYPPLYEAAEIMNTYADVEGAHEQLRLALAAPTPYSSAWTRQRALDLFSVDVVAPQWASYLGVKVAVAA